MIPKFLTFITLVLLSGCFPIQTSYGLFGNKESKKLFQEAQKHQMAGNLDSALFYFNKADEAAPNTPVILHERGILKAQKRLYTGAIEDMNRSISLVSSIRRKKAWINNRALTYMSMGDIDNACKDWHLIRNDYYIKKYCN